MKGVPAQRQIRGMAAFKKKYLNLSCFKFQKEEEEEEAILPGTSEASVEDKY